MCSRRYIKKRKERAKKILDEYGNYSKYKRKYKNYITMEGRQRYRQFRNNVNREVIKAKKTLLEEQCEEIEKLFKRNRADQAYCKILNIVGITNKLIKL